MDVEFKDEGKLPSHTTKPARAALGRTGAVEPTAAPSTFAADCVMALTNGLLPTLAEL